MLPVGPLNYRAIAPEETLPLRQKILRRHQALQECRYPGDEAASSLHVGCFANGVLIGVGTIMEEAPESGDYPLPAWRVRGMAIVAEYRAKGIGGEILRRLVHHADSTAPGLIWCNARTGAVGLYMRHGFEQTGDEFDLQGIGPHVRMVRAAG